ncbi:MAG: 3-hydroxyacyl-CoA dehydrogenase NAD-binding domain-containing protein [Verrucomicrobiae bacterium]|nr:3-hydroxyacyl-CoA dehydrogenase NAD-binding domain-containing protein [Verrucomicrobiae bacterium]
MSTVDYVRSGTLAVLRLNAPPVNAITPTMLEELRVALRRALTEPQVRGIVITGNDRHFSAGADVNLFREIATAEDAVRISRAFQEAFQEIEDSDKPVAAAVTGHVAGGALELAMACHFRACTSDSRFSMPEVKLGIVPGAGGTQRLPRLIGTARALRMLLTGEPISAEEALAARLVDAVCEGADLIEQAACLLDRPIRRTGSLRAEPDFSSADQLLAGARPEIIAPWRILDAVRAGLCESFEAGLRKEQTGFAECMATTATRNKLYVFFASRQTASVSAPAAAVRRVGVVGMGTMGTGIAHAVILAGLPVVALDQSEEILRRGISRIQHSLEKRSPKCAAEVLSLLRATTEWADLADADLVIEAVFEDPAVKRDVLGGLEEVCRKETIIATNTSTISLEILAERMRHPQRLVGLHFFNPAHRMPLVEVIYRPATAPEVVATALEFVKRLRKTPVLVRNREGFLVNRLFIPYMVEAFRLLEEGAEPRAVDSAMVGFGFPMGPFVLIDMAGLDILARTAELMRRAFPGHAPLPEIAVRLVALGHLGQKTGSGVYRYREGDREPLDSETTAKILRELQPTPRSFTAGEIAGRLVGRMIQEATCVLKEGLVQRESDVDVASVLGLGFPDWRGGVLQYARQHGLANNQQPQQAGRKTYGN